jgi:hypothetical protein
VTRDGPPRRHWLLGAAAVLFTAGSAVAQVTYPELTVSGELLANGIFDPSVEYDGAGTTGWLAYSSVYGDVTPWGPHVETHLARSDDRGASWSFVQVVNPSTVGTLTLPGQADLDGVWNAEVASLVHDPDEPGREWKVFAHRIFRKSEDGFVGEQNVPSHSWIALRSASDPAGPWSAERALLSSGPLPPAPYDTVEVAINALDPSLADLLVYSEPGAFYRDGVLYLSLTGLTLDGPDRIVLLASDDHGDSWRFVSSPLSNADAPALGWESFDGSAIAAEGGRVFLLVSPGTPSLLHDGTLVLEFEDLAAGRLVREGGVPVLHKHVPLQPAFASERGAGQSDHHEHNTAGGLLMPQIKLPDFPRFFQIFETGERLVDAAPVPATGGVARWLTALGLLCAIRRCALAARSPGRAESAS